jgi:hypothetical protein
LPSGMVLRDALAQPCRVVVRLIFREDGAQVLLLPKTSSMLVGADGCVRPMLRAMAAGGCSCDRGTLWHGDRPCCCDWPISV